VALQIWSGKWRKTWSTADFNIHRRHEKPKLCSTFLLKPLIKTPVGFCESCRGVVHLQLCYSPFGALLFKFLEKCPVKHAQTEMALGRVALRRAPTLQSAPARAERVVP
jgi:hypothetical protein